MRLPFNFHVILYGEEIRCEFDSDDKERLIDFWNKRELIVVNNKIKGSVSYFDLSKFHAMEIIDSEEKKK
jgi:hypothetical protein